MKSRWFTGVLAAVIVFLVIISVFVYQKKDRTAPVISFDSAELTYKAGDSYDKLLADVTAADDKDGNVTVYIENIFPLYDENQAKVYYAAVDQSGNVTKKSRIVTYISADPSESPNPASSTTPSSSPQPSSTKPTSSLKPSQTPSSKPSSSPSATPTPNINLPAITLTTNQVTLKIGESFSYMDYIAEMTDELDSYNDLARKIQVTGSAFSTKEAGTHEVEYKISNSRGTVSKSVFLTVIVAGQEETEATE